MEQLEKLEVETIRLNTDVENMTEYLDKIKKAKDAMETNIVNLNSMWDGEAKVAFVEQCNYDIETLSSIISEVDSFIKKWSIAKKKYDDCEMQVGNLINDIKV